MPKKTSKNPNPYAKPQPRSHTPVICLVIALIACAAVIGIWRHGQIIKTSPAPETEIPENEVTMAYQDASNVLREAVLKDILDQDLNVLPDGRCAVFLSYSTDRYGYRPTVRHATADTVETAWDNVDTQMKQAIKDSQSMFMFLKCDIVSDIENMTFEKLRENIKNNYAGQWHRGVALDENFDIAMLEQECNYYRIYDKEQANFLKSRLNEYLGTQYGTTVKNIPNKLTAFKCESWLYEAEDGQVDRLSSDNANYGIREFELSRQNLATMVATAGYYLDGAVDENGQFVYVFWPQDQDYPDVYSVARHIDSVWAMEQYYELTQDENIRLTIWSCINFLSNYTLDIDGAKYVRCTDKDEEPEEIRMGCQGLLLIVLSEYERLFNDNQFHDLLNGIAQGIINQTQPNGHVTNVLHLDMTTSRDPWSQYYDGQCVLGLCYAYRTTENQEYLNAARHITQYCLDNDHATIGDHWFTLAMNELTSILPDEAQYYEAGLLSVARQANELNKLRQDPTMLEKLMGGLGLYLRAMDNDITVPDEFDVKWFLRTIQAHGKDLLNDYLFPEKAMYSPCLTSIMGAFYVEYEEGWKIRIDLIQHHMDAYYRMYQNYDRLTELYAQYGL